ncbi:MAG: hypothetical protein SO253_02550 [Bacilli bacterium]|nr:hypothetical protein [Bacilli bacterium]
MQNKVLSITEKIVFSIVLLSLILTIILSIIAIPGAPTGDFVGNINDKTQSDYLLILVMGIPALIALFIPLFLKKVFKIDMPLPIIIIFEIFLFCAVVLGEYFSFYYRFGSWDNMLHFTSAVLLTYLSFSLVNVIVGEERVKRHPWMLLILSFAIAETLGIMWELTEFTMDGLWGLNSQKFMDGNGINLVGRQALMDTMGDIIVNSVGIVFALISGYYSLRHSQEFYNSLLIRNIKGEEVYENYASDGSVWFNK